MTIQVKFTPAKLIERAGVLALLGVLAISLPACSSVGDALGMGKSPPDEFAVVTKAPLIVPWRTNPRSADGPRHAGL